MQERTEAFDTFLAASPDVQESSSESRKLPPRHWSNPPAIQEPVFANIIRLLPLVFPPLVDIHVVFRSPYDGPNDPPSAAHYALDQVHFGLHHPALVKLLANAAHASPAARVSVMMEINFTEFTPYHDLPGFDKHAVERGYEAYLYDKFSTLRDLHAVPLHIRVDIP